MEIREATLPSTLQPWREEFIEKMEILIRLVSRYLTAEEVETIKEAGIFAAFAHQEQFRSSGEPYIFHPIAVATILTEVEIDAISIIGGILHDVIEDTEIGYEEIKQQFGEEVAHVVDGVTKLTQIRFRTKEEAKAESFRKMILAMTKDLRVIMVKLADRLHNMRTLGALPAYKKRRIAEETLEIYAPIASRLGIYAMQVYLENLCFQNLYPWRYAVIKKRIDQLNKQKLSQLHAILERIDTSLIKHNIISRLTTRRKHLWSIYQKILVKGSLEAVYDIFAIRVIVRSVDDCYRVLGIVHQLYKPIIGTFKDYIAIPKINGYQSLHTVVFGANTLPLEIQIRTRDMHIVAEAGAASHWRYKETSDKTNSAYQRTTKWLSDVSDLQDNVPTSTEFLESMKMELFPKDIYVFTPKGRIIELPKGATVLDFAYAVHSDIGNHFRKAYVNLREVPYDYPLSNGVTVDIKTGKNTEPSPLWLDSVVSARARSQIRGYLRSLPDDKAYERGLSIMQKTLDERGFQGVSFTPEKEEEILEELGFGSKHELLTGLARGKYPPQYVLNRYLIHFSESPELLPKRTRQAEDKKENIISAELIKGAEGMKTILGTCCYPLPGESIFGYMSTRLGLVVHSQDCPNREGFKKTPERIIPLAWQKNIKGDFPVKLYVLTKNRRGTIASLSATITELGLDFEDFNTEVIEGVIGKFTFVIRVTDRDHLAHVIRELKNLEVVERITRK